YALSILGPGQEFETKLFAKGEIEEQVLKGDLILHGGGDPLLNSSHLLQMIFSLKAKGVRQVSGKFLYDETALPHFEEVAQHGPMDQAYNTGLSALSSEFNRFYIYRWGRSSAGRKARFEARPPLPHVVFEKTSESFPRSERFRYQSKEDQEVWQVNNSVRYRNNEDIPVRDPALFTAHLFRLFGTMRGLLIALPPASTLT